MGMMDSESIFPLLESAYEGEESYGSQSSVAEVFMVGTPPPRTSRGRAVANPSVAVGNDAVDEDPLARE